MNPYEEKLSSETWEAHDKACELKLKMYTDPVDEQEHFTRAYILDRGFCCNQGCRHCPYWDTQIKIDFKE